MLLISFLAALLSLTNEVKYPVSQIAEELKKDVCVVVRQNEIRYKVLARNKATRHVFQVYTILNSNGKSFADKAISYDKLTKVTLFKASAYDQFGNLIKRVKNSEIVDQSAYDGSLFTDNRLKYVDLTQGVYPYTVEFEYELDYNFLFFTPTFELLPDEKISAEKGLFQLTFPADLPLRYELINLTQQPIAQQSADGVKSLTWSFENIKPIKLEPLGPSDDEMLPVILTAPTKFEYDGYVGTMSSWAEFGKWIGILNRERNILPEETRFKIRELTKDLKTVDEKVKRLYEYLQSKTRYVSIQLGIGGLQPFSATVVDQNGYGDCKGLSNYMVAMLGEVGIKANYTLISAGSDFYPMREGFPSSQFNHAVVSVPNDRDTLWLECTSQTNPFAYMGSFTGGRKALAITESGAAIVKTPFYSMENNTQSTTAQISLLATGDAIAKIKTSYSGLQYENGGLNFVVNQSPQEQKKWIQNNTDIPIFDLISFTMTNQKDRIPTAVVVTELKLNRFASVSGKRIFLTPNVTNRSTFIPEKVEQRSQPVIRKTAFIDFDTIHYSLPEGIYPEFLPQPINISSRYGEYEATFKLDDKGLLYVRKIKMKNGVFPSESYQELIEFYKNVNKADHTKIVFVNKT
jgi:hypothetical protein